MKKNYVLAMLCFFILISCSDDYQSIDEVIDEKAKNEVKVLSPQMKKFMTIDSSLYKQFCKDPEFVKTCSTYHRGIRVSGVIDRDRAKAIKTRINQMSVEYKDKYQCNNFLAYVFAYIKENYTSLGSRTSHDWGGCQYYGNDEYVVCNVRKNWDDAWNMYYVEQLDVVGSEDCIEMRAYMAAICDFFDSGYYIPGDNSGFSYVAGYFDYGHNYNYSYSEIYSEVTRRSIYYGSHFDDWSIEEMLNYMEFLGWSKEMICTYVYQMYDALWQATYYARSAYYDYSSLYEDNFTPYEPSNGGNYHGGTIGPAVGTVEVEWWKSGHNIIIDEALVGTDLDGYEISDIKEGSRIADMFQKVGEAHIHAMTQPGNTLEQTVTKMKDYFTENVLNYIYQYDMVSLGMALHPIMDVYSPAHAFKVWNGSYFAYIPHAFESVFIYYNEAEKAMVATLDIYCAIEYMDITGDMETDKYTVEEIFDNWIYGNIGPLNDENKK